MKEIVVKYAVGIFVILAMLTMIVSIVYLRMIGGFLPNEFTTLLGICIPMYAGYIVSIAAFLIKDKNRLKFESKKVNFAYVVFLFLFPLIFSSIIISSIWMKAYHRAFHNFEDYKNFLLTIQATFSVYVGMFIYSLYHRVEPTASSSECTDTATES